MQKNVASQKWIVFAFNRTNNQPVTGDAANITGNLRLDGGAANAIDDVNPTELEDGYYVFDISQAESNADNILLTAQSGTADVQVIGCPPVAWTRPPNFEALGIAADGDLSGNVDGSVASVTGAVGSVTGAVGSVAGNVDGSVASVTGAVGSVTGSVASVTGAVGSVTGAVGSVAAGGITAASIATDAIDADALAADALAEINAQVDAAIETYHLDHLLAANYDPAAKPGVATALLNELVESNAGVSRYTAAALAQAPDTTTGLSLAADQSAVTIGTVTNNSDMRGTDSAALASVCTEARLAELDAANLPDDVDAILVDTGTTIPALIAALNDPSVADILTTQMTEAYSVDGAAPTVAQALHLIIAYLTERSVSGTTVTAKKLDGVSTAATFTLDDATTPTSVTRAS